MGITIKYAKRADAEMVAAISRQTFYDSFAAQNTAENMQMHLDEYYSVSKIEKELADELNVFILVCEAEKTIGYAMLNEHAKQEAAELDNPIEIERIYAVKDAIGKGVGAALMRQCLEIAAQKQKNTIWLGVWEYNQRAIEFYAKWGFEKFGEHIFNVGDDPQTDWLMKKCV
jgi:diamine N-acetyltransferase